MTAGRCPVCGAAHTQCGDPAGAGTGVAVDAGLYGKGQAIMTNPELDKVERRWVETDLIWRLMKINRRDPRFAASEPYDPARADGGMPTVSLAELRAQRESGDESGDGDSSGDAANKSRGASNKARGTSAGPTSRRGSSKKSGEQETAGDGEQGAGEGGDSSSASDATGDAGAEQ